MNPHKVEKLTIKQSGAQIDVTEKFSKCDDLLLTYYSDARGESNPGLDGTTQIKSGTKWSGDTLFMLFENLPKLPQSNEAQRSDEWSLSKNSDTLTITITFASETPFSPIRGSKSFNAKSKT